MSFCVGGALAHTTVPCALQPANVFLDADFNAKLGDIGLAAMDSLYGQGGRGAWWSRVWHFSAA